MGRGLCNIPANAVALTGNLTTVQSGGGYLTLYPSNAPQPTVASTNYNANEIINNVFTVGLGPDGAFKIFAFFTTEVVVDVTGYYAPPAANGGLYFHPLPKPIRLLETRAGEVGCNTPGAPIQGGVAGTRTQQARLTCDGVTIPNGALAIVGNATTVGPQAGGYLTLFPANAAQPLVASSNYNAGQVVNGPFSVGLAPNGEFNIFSFATTDLVVDVLGYYSTEANDVNGAGLALQSAAEAGAPARNAGEPGGRVLSARLAAHQWRRKHATGARRVRWRNDSGERAGRRRQRNGRDAERGGLSDALAEHGAAATGGDGELQRGGHRQPALHRGAGRGRRRV
jgi:hypothetical protein